MERDISHSQMAIMDRIVNLIVGKPAFILDKYVSLMVGKACPWDILYDVD